MFAAWRLVTLPFILLALLLAGTPQLSAMARALEKAFGVPAPLAAPSTDSTLPLAGPGPGATATDPSTSAARSDDRQDDRARRGVLLPSTRR